MDSADELDEDFFGRLEALYDPDRVLIEWNGIWPQDQLKLPADWELFQQITIIDGSTFELYLNNMKPLLGLMVRNSELIIMNRCDDLTDDSLTRYRRGLKALNPQADLILEDAEGEIEQELLEEDLPYDMKADVIQITPEAYGCLLYTSPWAKRPPQPFSLRLMTAKPTIWAQQPAVAAPPARPSRDSMIQMLSLIHI